MIAKRRCRRLTAEEKKAVWANVDANAGAGWVSHGNFPYRRYPPNRQRDSAPELRPEKDLKI